MDIFRIMKILKVHLFLVTTQIEIYAEMENLLPEKLVYFQYLWYSVLEKKVIFATFLGSFFLQKGCSSHNISSFHFFF